MSELDREEQEILATFEAGEWQSVGEPDRLLELQSYAKDRRITLRLSSADLAAISLAGFATLALQLNQGSQIESHPK